MTTCVYKQFMIPYTRLGVKKNFGFGSNFFLSGLPFSGESGRFLNFQKILFNILLTSGGSGVILAIVTNQLQTVTDF